MKTKLGGLHAYGALLLMNVQHLRENADAVRNAFNKVAQDVVPLLAFDRFFEYASNHNFAEVNELYARFLVAAGDREMEEASALSEQLLRLYDARRNVLVPYSLCEFIVRMFRACHFALRGDLSGAEREYIEAGRREVPADELRRGFERMAADPEKILTHYFGGMAYESLGEDAEVLEDQKRAIEADPKFSVASVAVAKLERKASEKQLEVDTEELQKLMREVRRIDERHSQEEVVAQAIINDSLVPQNDSVEEIRNVITRRMAKGHWESAAMEIERLARRGQPLIEYGPKLVTCLFNAHESPLESDLKRIQEILNQLEGAGYQGIASPFRLHLSQYLKQTGKRKRHGFWLFLRAKEYFTKFSGC